MLALLLIACADSPADSGGYGFAVGPDMYPGDNCRSCHKADGPYPEAREWTVAGTVFADATGAQGVAGAIVRVRDDAGGMLELTTSASGNFYTPEEVVAPYRVEVEVEGVVSVMPASPPSGGCNACHAASPVGGAPGALFAGDHASTMTCDGASTLVATDGTSSPCDPCVCDASACRFDRDTDDDCVGGTTCDAERRCR
jgi:hypothetical protein